MGADIMPFADNWAYLKTELCWLDRLLMLAIARQRKESAAIGKAANAKGDRASAHWWKGVIAVSKPGYDDTRVPASARIIPTVSKENSAEKSSAEKGSAKTDLAKTNSAKAGSAKAGSAGKEHAADPQMASKKIGYQQQIDRRIQATAKENRVLALPSLRHYLNLTLFEKNLILLALAPEVNHRYGRLYHFLQTGEDCASASDLPTLDLALSLLCRNDLERRRSRSRLTAPGSLIEKRILRYIAPYPTTTRLNSYLQLNDDWVDYLLSEQPDQHVLFSQLATPSVAEKISSEHKSAQKPVLALPAPTPATRAVKITQPAISWDKVILPASLLAQLQALGQQTSASILTRYATPSTLYSPLNAGSIPARISTPTPLQGKVALLVGEAGTGKATAAGAMATSSRQPLCILDLRQVHPVHWKEVLDSLDTARYPVLYIRSASLWFGRNSPLPKAELAQWLRKRQTSPALTVLGTCYVHTVKACWRQQMDAVLTLPFPNKNARKILWRQAFAGITCSEKIDWDTLAKQIKLSGGAIENIAKASIAIAQQKNARAIKLSHIQRAVAQKDKTLAQAMLHGDT